MDELTSKIGEKPAKTGKKITRGKTHKVEQPQAEADAVTMATADAGAEAGALPQAGFAASGQTERALLPSSPKVLPPVSDRGERLEFWAGVMRDNAEDMRLRLKASEYAAKAEGDFTERVELSAKAGLAEAIEEGRKRAASRR